MSVFIQLFVVKHDRKRDNIMDMQAILTAVSTVGFPIACCISMGWYVKYITDKNREDLTALNADHKEEMTTVTTAINNNTLALQKLTDRMEQK